MNYDSIDKDKIEGLPTTPDTSGQQGGLEQDKQVIIRSFKVDSIKELTINKETYSNLTFDVNF